MTDYERLAADLTAAGINASVAAAYRLAQRSWNGEAINGQEATVVAAWEARTLAEPWHPTADRGRGS